MLIDTSGWLSVYHKDEVEHIKAVELYDAAAFCVTHSYILAEFVPLAHVRGFPRDRSLAFAERALDDPDLRLIWVDEELHRRAIRLLLDRSDKSYSICDAVSFVVMRDFGISDALTTDKHFEQEGFARLLHP